MVVQWFKGAGVGVLIFFVLFVLPKILIPFLFIVFVLLLCDWSGQGDGREGCNLHTTCNH